MPHEEIAGSRRRSSAVLAAGIASGAVLFAAAGDVPALGADGGHPVAERDSSCCWQVVTASSPPSEWAPAVEPASGISVAGQSVSASRRRSVAAPQMLAAGVAPERGLQVRTILAARSVSAAFPEIQSIGGTRADALRWHPDGLALDVMIPNPETAEGIALGNEIVAFVLENADRFALRDAIWRDVYYTPGGAQAGGYGHYDHVHITTWGGGYPTGVEIYYR